MLGLDVSLPTVSARGRASVPLVLDFVEGLYLRDGVASASFVDLSGVSFARARAGLVARSNGTLATAAANVPRITDRGLLLETEATNLWTHSDDFTDPVWGGVGTRVGGFSAPDGSENAVEITLPDAAVILSRALAGAGVAGGVSGKVFVKSAEAFTWSSFLIRNNTTATNLSSRAVDFSASPSGTVNGWTVTPMADGWFELAFAREAGIFPGDAVQIYFGNTGSNFNGRKIRLWGGNFFPSPTPGSPVPTGAASATRGADIASVIVPATATTWEAVHGEANTVVTGAVTPGATFDLVTGRPWLNGFLKRLTMI